MAFIAYVPLLLSSPGSISADTKAYLYLDPGSFLQNAPNMWNTHIDAGTVTHQNIGYLFPLGPWYWIFDALGIPTWIAQRLWFGSLLFVAGAATVWMLRRLGMRGAGPVVAGFVYMLSPYVLAYMGRTSVILTPWSALPLLIGLMFVALKEQTWRAPVLFALVVTVIAGTNASSVIFVLIAPILLVPYAIWVTHDAEFRSSLRTLLRIAITTGPAQLWWLAGLYVQGKYGLPILQLTETVETVAQTSTAAEGIRGLGYWYFYGKDGLTNWTESGPLFTQTLIIFVVSFVLPTLAFLAAILTRWKWRAYFVLLMIVGLVFAIGTYPFADPSPVGSLVKITTSLEVGFALRNSPRILPLFIMGMAALIGIFVEALQPFVLRRFAGRNGKRLVLAIPLAVIAIAIVNLPPLWNGSLIQNDMKFPEEIPPYWTEAASWLDVNGSDRVLELPGADFGAYRWGQTQDPVAPGLLQRDWIGRELTAYGSPATVDLLRALDSPFQEGTADASAVADVARLFSSSNILLRLDSQYERYHGPRPADLWTLFGSGSAANGLSAPTTFGEPTIAIADPRQPTRDEIELARQGSSVTPPLAVFSLEDVRSIIRSESARHPVVIWGDGQGLVETASAGLLPRNRPLFYAATVNNSPKLHPLLSGSSPSLIITDTNRKRAQRWGTTRENNGATETANGSPVLVDDPKDTRIGIFPNQSGADQTVAWYGDDVANVAATSYGNIVAYSTEVRPVNAIDGDPRTAWSTGGYSEVIGDSLQISYAHPVTTDRIDLLQTQGNRFITKVTVLLDGVPVATVDLSDSSFEGAGQRIDFGSERSFERLSVRIDATNISGLQNYVGVSNVGFREVTVPGVSAQEWILTPSNGVNNYPDAPLTYVFSRWRANPIEGYRQDPELRLLRIFTSPNSVSKSLTGQTRLTADGDSEVIDRTLGRQGLEAGLPIVSGTTYLDGVPAYRPSSALDNDPSTTWVTPFGNQVGASFVVTNPSTFSMNALRFSYVDDGSHSIPTRLNLTGDDGVTHNVDVPKGTPDSKDVVSVEIPTETITTRSLRVAIGGEREITTTEYFGGGQHAFPVAIVDLGLPVALGPIPVMIPDSCRSGLLSLNGTDIPVRVSGTTSEALSRSPLAYSACSGPVILSQGSNRLSTTQGFTTGLEIDTASLVDTTQLSAVSPETQPPSLNWKQTGDLSYSVDVADSATPFWLVLGQSLSEGWTANIAGGPSLGAPTLIDGFANGWYIDGAQTNGPLTIDLKWKPQRAVGFALWASGLWLALLIAASIVVNVGRRPRTNDQCPPPALVPSLRSRSSLPFTTKLWSVGGLTIFGAAIGGTGVALATAFVASLALWTKRRTLVTALASVLSVAGIVILYVGLQARRRYPTGVEWPSSFWIAHQLALVALVAVVVDSALRFFSARTDHKKQKAKDASQISDGSALTR